MSPDQIHRLSQIKMSAVALREVIAIVTEQPELSPRQSRNRRYRDRLKSVSPETLSETPNKTPPETPPETHNPSPSLPPPSSPGTPPSPALPPTPAGSLPAGACEEPSNCIPPVSLEAALKNCGEVGATPAMTEKWWNDLNGVGWVDGKSRVIRNWKSNLRAFVIRHQENDFRSNAAQRMNGGNARPDPSTAPAVNRWAEPETAKSA